MKNLQDIILQKIQTGELKMAPRWHFVLRTALYGSGVLLVALIAVYLMSFVMFLLYRNGLFFAPAFGLRGLVFIVVASPWLLIAVTLIFLGLLLALVRNFAFSYRRPLVYSLLAASAGVLLVSTLIHMTMMHERVRSFVEGRGIPGMSALYTDHRPSGVSFGLIGKITDQGFLLLLDDTGEALDVATTTNTHLPSESLQVGTRVMVFGDVNTGKVTALGVRPIHDDDDLPPAHPHPMFFHHE